MCSFKLTNPGLAPKCWDAFDSDDESFCRVDVGMRKVQLPTLWGHSTNFGLVSNIQLAGLAMLNHTQQRKIFICSCYILPSMHYEHVIVSMSIWRQCPAEHRDKSHRPFFILPVSDLALTLFEVGPDFIGCDCCPKGEDVSAI